MVNHILIQLFAKRYILNLIILIFVLALGIVTLYITSKYIGFSAYCEVITDDFDRSMCFQSKFFIEFFTLLFFMSCVVVSFITLTAGFLLKRKWLKGPSTQQQEYHKEKLLYLYGVIFFPLITLVFMFIPGVWYLGGYAIILVFLLLFLKFLKDQNGGIWPTKSFLFWMVGISWIAWILLVIELDLLEIADGIFSYLY